MKTHTIKTPTAELLIIELHEGTADFSVMNTGDRLAVCAFDENDHCLDVKGISKDYTLLGKPDEIREEDAEKLVEKDDLLTLDAFKNYQDNSRPLDTATESLLSAIESVIFWVNPLGEKELLLDENTVDLNLLDWDNKSWHNYQSRTFNRTRTLIFVKN